MPEKPSRTAKWAGRVVELVDGCDNQHPHRTQSVLVDCVTSKQKVRIIEVDPEGKYFWARTAG